MAQQAKKQAPNVEKKILEMGREGVEEIMREADAFTRMAHECMGVCTSALSAGVESGSAASRTLSEMGSQIMENVNRAFSDNAELLKEAFACRTVGDAAKLQEKFWQRTFVRYSDEATAMMDTLFDGCGKAMEPLQEQTANASGQLRKAMAA